MKTIKNLIRRKKGQKLIVAVRPMNLSIDINFEKTNKII